MGRLRAWLLSAIIVELLVCTKCQAEENYWPTPFATYSKKTAEPRQSSTTISLEQIGALVINAVMVSYAKRSKLESKNEIFFLKILAVLGVTASQRNDVNKEIGELKKEQASQRNDVNKEIAELKKDQEVLKMRLDMLSQQISQLQPPTLTSDPLGTLISQQKTVTTVCTKVSISILSYTRVVNPIFFARSMKY